MLIVLVCVVGLSSCSADTDSTDCTCSSILNGVAQYPADSEASCTGFGKRFNCAKATYGATEADCGGQAPCCQVTACASSCSCAAEPP